MASELFKISEIKSNPNNPRVIKDDKFKKLVQSLKDFPAMAAVRPIVVNTDMIVLGGNMRLKAMKEAGWKEVPVTVVDWSEEKQKEFIIKDNVGFGEWDWEVLSNEWDSEQLEEWGLNIVSVEDNSASNIKTEEIKAYKKHHILFSFHPDIYLKIKDYLESIIEIDGVEYEQSNN